MKRALSAIPALVSLPWLSLVVLFWRWCDVAPPIS